MLEYAPVPFPKVLAMPYCGKIGVEYAGPGVGSGTGVGRGVGDVTGPVMFGVVEEGGDGSV